MSRETRPPARPAVRFLCCGRCPQGSHEETQNHSLVVIVRLQVKISRQVQRLYPAKLAKLNPTHTHTHTSHVRYVAAKVIPWFVRLCAFADGKKRHAHQQGSGHTAADRYSTQVRWDLLTGRRPVGGWWRPGLIRPHVRFRAGHVVTLHLTKKREQQTRKEYMKNKSTTRALRQ